MLPQREKWKTQVINERLPVPLRCMHHRPGCGVTVDFLEAVEHAESHAGETVEVAVAVDLIHVNTNNIPDRGRKNERKPYVVHNNGTRAQLADLLDG